MNSIRKQKILAVTLLILASTDFAGALASSSPVSSPAKNNNSDQAYFFTVAMGEKNTDFELKNDSGKFLFLVKQNGVAKKRGEISAKDFYFYSDLFQKASVEKSNSREYCANNNLELRMQSEEPKLKKAFACLGSKTKIAVKMSKLANALSLLL